MLSFIVLFYTRSLKKKRETTHHSLQPENKWAQPSKRLSPHCSVYMSLPYIQLEACWDLMVHCLYLPKKTNWGPLLSALAYKIAFLSPQHILKSVRTFKIKENLSSPPYKPKGYVAFVLFWSGYSRSHCRETDFCCHQRWAVLLKPSIHLDEFPPLKSTHTSSNWGDTSRFRLSTFS